MAICLPSPHLSFYQLFSSKLLSLKGLLWETSVLILVLTPPEGRQMTRLKGTSVSISPVMHGAEATNLCNTISHFTDRGGRSLDQCSAKKNRCLGGLIIPMNSCGKFLPLLKRKSQEMQSIGAIAVELLTL